MRLSRPRVLLRAVLLAVAAAFMFWKAWAAHQGSQAAAGTSEAVPLARLALFEGLMGLLGLAAAGMALLALRVRKRTHTLRLGDLQKGGGARDQDTP